MTRPTQKTEKIEKYYLKWRSRQVQVELHKMSGGRQPWYLILVASNGEVIAVSEGYYSKWNAKRAAKKNFPDVNFVDATNETSEN